MEAMRNHRAQQRGDAGLDLAEIRFKRGGFEPLVGLRRASAGADRRRWAGSLVEFAWLSDHLATATVEKTFCRDFLLG
jgi:hypothetical protein